VLHEERTPCPRVATNARGILVAGFSHVDADTFGTRLPVSELCNVSTQNTPHADTVTSY